MFYIQQIFHQSNMFGTNILEHDLNMRIHVQHRMATTENVALQKMLEQQKLIPLTTEVQSYWPHY